MLLEKCEKIEDAQICTSRPDSISEDEMNKILDMKIYSNAEVKTIFIDHIMYHI